MALDENPEAGNWQIRTLSWRSAIHRENVFWSFYYTNYYTICFTQVEYNDDFIMHDAEVPIEFCHVQPRSLIPNTTVEVEAVWYCYCFFFILTQFQNLLEGNSYMNVSRYARFFLSTGTWGGNIWMEYQGLIFGYEKSTSSKGGSHKRWDTHWGKHHIRTPQQSTQEQMRCANSSMRTPGPLSRGVWASIRFGYYTSVRGS